MRLIDADTFFDNLDCYSDKNKIQKMLDRQPTAYNVDAVVKELRKSEMCPRCANNDYEISYCATFCDVGKKLEFVRKGGVNE